MIGNNGGRGFVGIGGINGSTRAEVDEFNKALVVQDEVHHNIHRGIFFSASDLVLSLANNDSEELILSTSGVVHMRATISASAQSLIRFFEGTTVSASGAQVPLYNRNRLSSIASGTMGVFRAPTVSDDGTLLLETFGPGGTKKNAVGSESSAFHEWILRPDTIYLFRITNTSGGVEDISIEIDVYEPGLAT